MILFGFREFVKKYCIYSKNKILLKENKIKKHAIKTNFPISPKIKKNGFPTFALPKVCSNFCAAVANTGLLMNMMTS